MNLKKDLARQIVKELNGDRQAKDAENNFERIVQKKEIPEEISVYILKNREESLVNILVETKLASKIACV